MDQTQLRDGLSAISISPNDLAVLLDVTPRAVSMWLSGERGIPGPVAAYLDLLLSLAGDSRAAYIRNKLQGAPQMRDGLFHVYFTGQAGSGQAVIIIQNGTVFGSDEAGGNYDGVCQADPATGLTHLRLTCSMPANQQSVLGPNLPYPWTVQVAAMLDTRLDHGPVRVQTDKGTISASFRYMRPLPIAA